MELSTEKIELFETMPVPKAVFKMALPSTIASLLVLLYNLADAFFVGLLNDPVQSSAVTLAASVMLSFNVIANIFGLGASSLFSRALGTKDYDSARKASAFGIYGAIIFSILLSILMFVFNDPLLVLIGTKEETYIATKNYLFWVAVLGAPSSIMSLVFGYFFKGEGSAILSSIGSMGGAILNIILDPIFILPNFLNLGVTGAGLATFISNTCSMIFFFICFFIRKNKSLISLAAKDFTSAKPVVKDILTVGIPSSIQNILNVIGSLIINNIAADYGTNSVAAIGYMTKIHNLPLYLAMGVVMGVSPLMGYSYSAKNKERFKEVFSFTLKLTMSVILVITLACIFFSKEIMLCFIKNEEVVELGAKLISLISFGLPFMIIDFQGVSVYVACGLGKKSLFAAILRKLLTEIPAVLILTKVFGIYGLALGNPVSEIIMTVYAVLSIRSIFKSLE